MSRRIRYRLGVGLRTPDDPPRWDRGFLGTGLDPPRWGRGFPDMAADPRLADSDTEAGRDDFDPPEVDGLDTLGVLPEYPFDFDRVGAPVGPRLESRFDPGSLGTPADRWDDCWDTAVFRVGLPAFLAWAPALVLVVSRVPTVPGSDTVVVPPRGPLPVPRSKVFGPRGLAVREVWARVRSLAPAVVFPP